VQQVWRNANVTPTSSGNYVEGLVVALLHDEVQRMMESQWQMARLETKKYDEVGGMDSEGGGPCYPCDWLMGGFVTHTR